MKCPTCQTEMTQAKDSWLCVECGHLEPRDDKSSKIVSTHVDTTSKSAAPTVPTEVKPTPAIEAPAKSADGSDSSLSPTPTPTVTSIRRAKKTPPPKVDTPSTATPAAIDPIAGTPVPAQPVTTSKEESPSQPAAVTPVDAVQPPEASAESIVPTAAPIATDDQTPAAMPASPPSPPVTSTVVPTGAPAAVAEPLPVPVPTDTPTYLPNLGSPTLAPAAPATLPVDSKAPIKVITPMTHPKRKALSPVLIYFMVFFSVLALAALLLYGYRMYNVSAVILLPFAR